MSPFLYDPLFLILFLMLGGLITGLVAYIRRTLAGVLALSTLACGFFVSIYIMLSFSSVMHKGSIISTSVNRVIGGFAPALGIEIRSDLISLMMIALVCFMGAMAVAYSMCTVQYADPLKEGGYYSLVVFLALGLVGMASSGDVFTLYIFLEIASISSYCLVALGRSGGFIWAFRYLMTGTMGTGFYLLAIAFLYMSAGSLNMNIIASHEGDANVHYAMLAAMILFLVGFGIKMGLFPLHGWLPDAYSSGHWGAMPLIAGVGGKLPAYCLFKFLFIILGHRSFIDQIRLVLLIISLVAIFYGSIAAIRQKYLVRMLAYSSVAQMGYIGIAISMGNYLAFAAMLLHIIAHGVAKGGLFIIADIVGTDKVLIKPDSESNMKDIVSIRSGEIDNKDKILLGISFFILGGSMIGMPPMAGFFSKLYLALGAMDMEQSAVLVAIIASSLLTVVYFYRIADAIFISKYINNLAIWQRPRVISKQRLAYLPALLCAVMLLITGIIGGEIVDAMRQSIMEVMNL